MTRRLLIAGVGNLFLGDDAFGCEVTRRLKRSHPRPGAGIELRDFGVSVRALGYELADRRAAEGGERIVIVDAVATGAAPGTLQLFDLGAAAEQGAPLVTHHAQGLAQALHTARALGARLDGTYLIGCEPDCFEPSLVPQGDFLSGGPGGALLHGVGELTPHVEAAAERCVALLHQLIEQPERDLVTLCLN